MAYSRWHFAIRYWLSAICYLFLLLKFHAQINGTKAMMAMIRLTTNRTAAMMNTGGTASPIKPVIIVTRKHPNALAAMTPAHNHAALG